MIWGKPDVNKKGEEYFKVEHKQLEFDKNNVEPDLMSFAQYLEDKFKPLTQEEYDSLEQKEKSLEEMNQERNSEKIKELCDIVEANHAGAKFKRMFEDMRKKLHVDEKIQVDLNLKLDNTKLDEKILNEPVSPKFTELEKDMDRKEKFKVVFRNSYHNLIISFFNMLINLKKIKQDFAIVFRFFGQDESDIEQLVYEYNCFCDCLHPRYCGDYGYNKVKFDVEKDKKDFRIDTKSQEFISVSYRGEKEEEEKLVLNTMKHPPNEEPESEGPKNIDEFYKNENENKTQDKKDAEIISGYKDTFLNFMGKLTQNCTFCILDDYNYYKKNDYKHGKLFLIDPYDVDTLQIFFDSDLHKYPEKLDVIDIVTKKKIPLENCLNKFVVNVEPYRAIIDVNYFNHKIEDCVNNRKNELLKMQGKQVVESTQEEINIEEEIKKIPLENCLNKYVVNVEPYRAIIDINYFNHKIEECVNIRKEEINIMQGKQSVQPVEDENLNLNIQQELKKMPGDLYLKMTVLPLLHNALNMCEIVRPSDPIAFISNFMLINKGTSKTMEDLIKEIPKYHETEDIEQELLLGEGEYSREEKNDMAGEQFNEEKKENGENNMN